MQCILYIINNNAVDVANYIYKEIFTPHQANDIAMNIVTTARVVEDSKAGSTTNTPCGQVADKNIIHPQLCNMHGHFC